MTQEDKQLLFIDLSARLPYGVKIDREWIAPMSGSPEHSIMELDTFDIEVIKTSIELGEEGNYRDSKMQGLTTCDGETHFIIIRGYMCKPYLRPISSMTEEEIKTYHSYCECNDGDFNGEILYFDTIKSFDYLTSIHIDYRGMIEKGLALEAPEGMYKNE